MPQQQFSTSRAFAEFMAKERWGRKRVRYFNQMPGADRIERLVSDILRYSSPHWPIEEGGIQSDYNQAAYGLRWVIDSGRINATTVLAIRAMTTRQLCELVHDLMVFDNDIGRYPAYLMRQLHKASTKARK